MELWQPVPNSLFHDVGVSVEASNKGNVRADNVMLVKHAVSEGPGGGRYSSVRLKSKSYYVHHLVYFAFNPDKVGTGRIGFVPIIESMIENGLYRCYLEDLVFEQFATSNKKDATCVPILNQNHPIYGHYVTGEWSQLKAWVNKKLVEFPNYTICINNTNVPPCFIRGPRKMLSFGEIDPQVVICSKEFGKLKISVPKLMLASTFSTIPCNTTLDHIDQDYKNNHINNLQWLSLSDNSKKNVAYQQEQGIRKNGKSITLVTNDGNEINFVSGRLAAEYVFNTTPGITSDIKKIEEYIRRARKNPSHKVFGYNVKSEDLEDRIIDEVWTKYTVGDYTYEVSDHGAFKTLQGKRSKGTNIRGKKYRQVGLLYEKGSLKQKKMYIHHLVWKAFHGDVPEGFEVLHDDNAPLDEGCYYRNYLLDLRLGTRRENMKEHVKAKKERLATTQKLT